MCDFLSFVITKGDKPLFLTEPQMSSHSATEVFHKLPPNSYREVEWTTDDPKTITIRSLNREEIPKLKAYILTNYPTRDKLIAAFSEFFEKRNIPYYGQNRIVAKNEVAEVGVAGIAQAGDDGIARAKNHGMARAGNWGIAKAGYKGSARVAKYGTAQADDYGSAIAGESGVARVCDNGYATAGAYGYAIAEEEGKAQAGECGYAIAGAYGRAIAGDEGTAIVGNRGYAQVGKGGTIQITYATENGFSVKMAMAGAGKGFIKPDTLYMVKGGRLARAPEYLQVKGQSE